MDRRVKKKYKMVGLIGSCSCLIMYIRVHYVVVVVVVAIASIDIAEHYLRSLGSLFRLMMTGL